MHRHYISRKVARTKAPQNRYHVAAPAPKRPKRAEARPKAHPWSCPHPRPHHRDGWGPFRGTCRGVARPRGPLGILLVTLFKTATSCRFVPVSHVRRSITRFSWVQPQAGRSGFRLMTMGTAELAQSYFRSRVVFVPRRGGRGKAMLKGGAGGASGLWLCGGPVGGGTSLGPCRQGSREARIEIKIDGTRAEKQGSSLADAPMGACRFPRPRPPRLGDDPLPEQGGARGWLNRPGYH